MNMPNTNVSLILRLRDQTDVTAWHEFVAIYRPAIARVVRGRGFQEADVHEITQEVFLAVARAVSQWQPDGTARFRTWLARIVNSKLVDVLRRNQRRTQASGGSSGDLPLRDYADWRASVSAEIEQAYRRELFRRAAQHVQRQVKPATWQAFWLTSVESMDASDVARTVGLSVGAVYVARSRVLLRLREFVQAYEREAGVDKS